METFIYPIEQELHIVGQFRIVATAINDYHAGGTLAHRIRLKHTHMQMQVKRFNQSQQCKMVVLQ